jgi:fatty acid desaturase
MGTPSAADHSLGMRELRPPTGKTGQRPSRATRPTRYLFAAAMCTAAAAASFAAGAAPGFGWALLVIGMALMADALASR